jgi:excisionase family DNA binding protein
MTVAQAAALLGLSPSQVRRACQSGELPAQLAGKTYWIADLDFETYKAKRVDNPPKPGRRAK